MFSKTAKYYDKIYSFKDYQKEASLLVEIIQHELGGGKLKLLDVACGSGNHLVYFKEHFDVSGLDLDDDLLEIAKKKLPGINLYHKDMISFDLHFQYDVITCLFSAIGYAKTLGNLQRALVCMLKHLLPGGLLLIEPWFTPEMWHPGSVHAVFIDEPDLKISRINLSQVDGRISWMDMHYLIGTLQGVEHHIERHELGLFTQEEMMQEIIKAGASGKYDEAGVTGRGLYICKKPFAS